jgi:hypothetical protein
MSEDTVKTKKNTLKNKNPGLFQRDSVHEFPAKFIGAISKILMTSTFVWCDKGLGFVFRSYLDMYIRVTLARLPSLRSGIFFQKFCPDRENNCQRMSLYE